MGFRGGKVGSGRFSGSVKFARARYDFAVDGGAVGDIALRGDKLPKGAIVTDCYVVVGSALTSGGAATVALKAEGAADLNAADAFSGAPFASGVSQTDKVTAGGTRVRTTAERSVTATVGTAALTGGAFDVVVAYIQLA